MGVGGWVYLYSARSDEVENDDGVLLCLERVVHVQHERVVALLEHHLWTENQNQADKAKTKTNL